MLAVKRQNSNVMSSPFKFPSLIKAMQVPIVPTITRLTLPKCNAVPVSATVGATVIMWSARTSNACAFPVQTMFLHNIRKIPLCMRACCVLCACRQILMIMQPSGPNPGPKTKDPDSVSSTCGPGMGKQKANASLPMQSSFTKQVPHPHRT